MGQCWREETEIGDLRQLVIRLYADVKYLYTLLHSFVRHKLEKFYGIRFHQGLIPAHLLGNSILILTHTRCLCVGPSGTPALSHLIDPDSFYIAFSFYITFSLMVTHTISQNTPF